MNIKHIIVGTDFSRESAAAVDHAMHIARLQGAEITLVHVCPVVEPPSRTISTQWTTLMQGHLTKNRKALEELRTTLSGQGPKISHVVIDDMPDSGIIQGARELSGDLIAVGTHGFTGIKHMLLGSVAERTIRHSPVSVLVARQGNGPPSESPPLSGGYRKILVPTDFSPSAEYALRMACELAAPSAQIDVWHFWHTPYGSPMPYPDPMRMEIEASARAAGEELTARYREKMPTLSFATAEAPPKYGIQHQINSQDYDLVVIGSHGRTGIARWLIGSIAEATVRHSPCSVLVTKQPHSESA